MNGPRTVHNRFSIQTFIAGQRQRLEVIRAKVSDAVDHGVDEDLDLALNEGGRHSLICSNHLPNIKTIRPRAQRRVRAVLSRLPPCRFAPRHASGRRSFDLLFLAHGCHHSIVQAIRMRDGGRADGLMREHAYQQRLSMFERRLGRGGILPKAPPGAAKVPPRI